MHRHTLAPLATANERVVTERDQLQEELEAFEAFADRVAATDAQRPPAGPSGTAHRSVAARPAGSTTERLRTAFRETVMSVPHYEEVYDEPLFVHAEGELGPDVAASLRSDGSFSLPFKRVLENSVAQAAERRRRVLGHLSAEVDSLAAAKANLRAVTASMDELMAADEGGEGERPGDVEERIRAVASERQTLIHDRRSTFEDTGSDLCSYLYGESGGWTYPVLSVTASLQRDVDALKRRTRSGDATIP